MNKYNPSAIPDENKIEELLTKIQPVPSGQFHKKMAQASWRIGQGQSERAIEKSFRIRMAFVMMALAMIAALIATPQGRAFAQNILRYFVRAESDTRAVPTLSPVIALVSAETPDDTPPAPFFETRLTFEAVCGDIYSARCSLSEIRDMVDFPVKGLGETLDGIAFVGATGGPERVILFYIGEGVNGTLSISEEPANAGQSWPVAASAKVESVSIGSATGEYVQGGWYSVDANDGVSWYADEFVQTLRWETDSILHTMVFHAGKSSGTLLHKTDMLYLAEHLTTDINERVSPKPTPLMEIQQISQEAGFTVIEPDWVPEGYVFLDAAYGSSQNTVCLYYSHGSGTSPVLAIAERPATASSILDDITKDAWEFDGQQINIPVVTESLPVGGADGGQAVWASNGVNAAKLCPYQDFITNQVLFWQSNEKSFAIFGLLDQYEGGVFVSRLEMQRLAENLTGVTTIPNDRLDPEHLHTVEDANSFAAFEVKAPTQMVTGVQFYHAAYLEGDQTRTVKLVYTPGTPTRGGIDYGFFITQSVGSIRTLEEVYLWGGYEYVSINSQTALYRLSCWDVTGGGTDCYQELSWDENGVGYDIKAYFPGALDKKEFFAIAESLQ